jgi:peptidoglycan/LPS O-acetylase OafA/YrhL
MNLIISKNVNLQSLRGLAAVMIIFYHMVELSRVKIPHGLSFISTHFGVGVPLFFALSGFVLSLGYSDKLSSGGINQIRNFYIKRFFRIAPLFYFVLISFRIFGAFFVWGFHDSYKSIFLNLSFLFGLYPGSHESLVMGGWSIGVEMLFYLIFPILITFIFNIWAALICLIFTFILSWHFYHYFSDIGMGSYAYMNLLTHLPFFISGIFAFQAWKFKKFELQKTNILPAALVLAILILVINNQKYFTFLDFDRNSWAILFIFAIYFCCASSLELSSYLAKFGDISFSAYLLHPMILVFLMQMGIVSWINHFNDVSSFLIGTFIVFTLTYILSFITYRCIELPGIKLGSHLLKKLNYI